MSLSEFFPRPDGNVRKQTPSETLWLRRHTNKTFIQSSGSLGEKGIWCSKNQGMLVFSLSFFLLQKPKSLLAQIGYTCHLPNAWKAFQSSPCPQPLPHCYTCWLRPSLVTRKSNDTIRSLHIFTTNQKLDTSAPRQSPTERQTTQLCPSLVSWNHNREHEEDHDTAR